MGTQQQAACAPDPMDHLISWLLGEIVGRRYKLEGATSSACVVARATSRRLFVSILVWPRFAAVRKGFTFACCSLCNLQMCPSATRKKSWNYAIFSSRLVVQ